VKNYILPESLCACETRPPRVKARDRPIVLREHGADKEIGHTERESNTRLEKTE